MANVIGIYGRIGTGKSTVAKIIQEKYGFYRIDGDLIGHRLLETKVVKEHLVKVFGLSIISESKQINRKKLSQVVFVNKNLKKELEHLLWPKMTIEIEKILKTESDVVLDAAILFSAGWNSFCRDTIYVDATLQKIEENLKERSLSKEEMKQIVSSQQEILKQKDLATYRIVNDGTLQDLTEKVVDLFQLIQKRRTKDNQPK
jgi:dephospho-CoA kinase